MIFLDFFLSYEPSCSSDEFCFCCLDESWESCEEPMIAREELTNSLHLNWRWRTRGLGFYQGLRLLPSNKNISDDCKRVRSTGSAGSSRSNTRLPLGLYLSYSSI